VTRHHRVHKLHRNQKDLCDHDRNPYFQGPHGF
jgi:hypothetical protein